MRHWVLIGAFSLLTFSQTHAAEPSGEWIVADGTAHISIDNCDQRIWGVVSWEKQPGGLDTSNPDPAKRSRAILGMPIIINMVQAKPDRWDGQVYNAKDGKTYTAHVTMLAPDQLRLEGCVLGFLCGGETWTRAPQERSTVGSARPAPPSGKPAVGGPKPTQTAIRGLGGQAKPASPVCAAVADASPASAR